MKPFLDLFRKSIAVLVASAAGALWITPVPGWAAESVSAGSWTAASGRFVDVTTASGVGDAIALHYKRHPNWWLSGLNLVDLDGDGKLDLFFASHGAGVSLALLNDGQGR